MVAALAKTVARPEASGPYADYLEIDWLALYEERAAILEYDAGYPREEAERRASVEIDAVRVRVRQR